MDYWAKEGEQDGQGKQTLH